jgi:hypothetical protein
MSGREGYPDLSKEPDCPAYEIPAYVHSLAKASALLENGALSLGDLDAWFYQGVFVWRSEYQRLRREEKALTDG